MNVLQAASDVYVLDAGTIQYLKILARESPLKRSRILLHESQDSAIQEMVLCVHRDSYVRPHKHPKGKSESYHLIEGEMRVNIFTEDGDLRERIELSSKSPMYRIQGNIYHQPLPVTEWAVYHEVYQGPFNKERDVLYAPWSKAE